MRKVVISICFGGFGLSKEAIEMLIEQPIEVRKYDRWYEGGPIFWPIDDESFDLTKWRDNLGLVQVVEELGSEKASGSHAELKVVEVPEDVEWIVSEYDGAEWIAEKHRTWG
jgi:hypothetical protein